VKFETVQSVVAATLALTLSVAMAAPPSIGIATAQGNFRIDSSTVSGNATLVEGTMVETQQAASALELSNGARISLGPDSKGRVFGDHIVLEKGSGQLDRPTGYKLVARELTIQPESGAASAHVALRGARLVDVAAVNGSLRVLNAKGVLVANLSPGAALEFDPQASDQGEPWKLSGCLRSIPGHFTLADDTTNVIVEPMGAGLDKEAGNRVEITGAMDKSATPVSGASQVIRVNQIRHLAKGCGSSKGAAAAAGAGGAAAGAGAAGTAAGGAILGVSTATVAIIGGVAAAGTVGGLAAAGSLPGQDSTPSVSR
jgi:hypothetical protein